MAPPSKRQRTIPQLLTSTAQAAIGAVLGDEKMATIEMVSFVTGTSKRQLIAQAAMHAAGPVLKIARHLTTAEFAALAASAVHEHFTHSGKAVARGGSGGGRFLSGHLKGHAQKSRRRKRLTRK